MKQSKVKILPTKIFLIFGLFAIFSSYAFAQDWHTFVGKVVDKKGKPIEGVKVINEPIGGGCVEWIFSAVTDKNGNFSLKENDNTKTLVFSPPHILFTYSPIEPPFHNILTKLSKQIVRKKLIRSEGETTNLGTIVADFPYTKVNFLMPAKMDSFRMPDDVLFSIYGKNNVQVSANRFDDVGRTLDGYAEDAGSRFTLVLPKGMWKLKLCKDWNCKKVIAQSNYFRVGKKEIRVKLRRISSRK